MALEGEIERAFGRSERAAEPSVFVCAGWSYGLRQFPVQMTKLLELLFPWSALGTSLRSLSPARTHSHPGTLWLAMEELFRLLCWP